ncbi:E3 ubiquitin-protein ligase MPSR1-like [Typha latifolia]|uniref:E3 ubiquitin-protein ligase MPSR1-like n=1 Tax=Typha latifolia TaxID=4733 RepID=UPI003C2C561C
MAAEVGILEQLLRSIAFVPIVMDTTNTVAVVLLSEILSGGDERLPTSKASIEALRLVEVTKEEECLVCLNSLRNREDGEVVVVKEMPCKHRFHGACVEKWLELHGSCPLCRYEMPIGEEGERKEEEEEESGRGELIVYR